MASVGRTTVQGTLGSLGTREERARAAEHQALANRQPRQQPFYSALPQLESKLGGVNYDERGINAFRNDALRTGESPWAAMQRERSGMDQSNALNAASATGNSQVQSGLSSLAQRGGLGAGARERLLSSGMKNSNQMRQSIYGQGAQRNLDIGIQDESNRMDMLGRLPGMESQRTATQLDQISPWVNLVGQEQKGRNDYNLGLYNTAMGGWAANKTANALALRGQ